MIDVVDGGFDLPQIGGLPDKQGAVGQGGEEMAAVRREIVVEIFIGLGFEIFATDFDGDHFFI